MDRDLKKILSFLLIILAFTGLSGVSKVLGATGQMFGFVIGLALKFPDTLGITDYVNTKIFYWILTALLGALGFALTKRDRTKVLGFASFVVSAISLLLSFAA